MPRLSAPCLLVAALVACTCTGSPPPASTVRPAPLTAQTVPRFVEEVLASSRLVYVSDYFSFVGEDSTGRMAFAMDNNRGRDGDTYQAEHLVFLHDEHRGWVDVPGLPLYEPYADPGGELRRIPDSPQFAFEGEPARGLVIRSRVAPLTLTLEPLALRLIRSAADRVFAMASAPATLQWQGRTLRGRVIYEYLVLKDANRLSRGTSAALLHPFSFQGLYLVTADGSDLYLHEQKGNGDEADSPPDLGFYSEHENLVETRELSFGVTGRKQGPGLFRWPDSWRASWNSEAQGPARLEAQASDIRSVTSFLFGGYAMGIVRGTLEQRGQRVAVYGWSELIQWLY